MKNLDLNNFGVQEMNAGEMRETDGGKDIFGWELMFPGIMDGYNPNLPPIFDGLGRPVVLINLK